MTVIKIGARITRKIVTTIKIVIMTRIAIVTEIGIATETGTGIGTVIMTATIGGVIGITACIAVLRMAATIPTADTTHMGVIQMAVTSTVVATGAADSRVVSRPGYSMASMIAASANRSVQPTAKRMEM